MTQQAQAQVQQSQQTVQVGFEKALALMNPNWRTAFTPEQVNQFRHFYHQGVQDMHLLNQMSHQNMQQNYQAVVNTIIVTGNEERIAELQRQQAEQAEQAGQAAAAPAQPSKPTKAKAPAKRTPMNAQLTAKKAAAKPAARKKS